jgi:hypothetical protein
MNKNIKIFILPIKIIEIYIYSIYKYIFKEERHFILIN